MRILTVDGLLAEAVERLKGKARSQLRTGSKVLNQQDRLTRVPLPAPVLDLAKNENVYSGMRIILCKSTKGSFVEAPPNL